MSHHFSMPVSSFLRIHRNRNVLSDQLGLPSGPHIFLARPEGQRCYSTLQAKPPSLAEQNLLLKCTELLYQFITSKSIKTKAALYPSYWSCYYQLLAHCLIKIIVVMGLLYPVKQNDFHILQLSESPLDLLSSLVYLEGKLKTYPNNELRCGTFRIGNSASHS